MIESGAISAEATKIVWTSDDLPNDALAANAPGSIRNWPRGFCRFCGTSRGTHGRRLVSHHQLEFAIQSADRVIGLRAGRMTDCPSAAFVQTDHRMIFVT
jgi:hypothetical protein